MNNYNNIINISSNQDPIIYQAQTNILESALSYIKQNNQQLKYLSFQPFI